ncbi:alpha/beta hydrolase [Pseudonocardia asaccharolytica]|uniref:Acetylhydrolase n=1 Tax=Pseudonocardia asaccharolytica DSM 44247 = NBRC 16224 TaxID=1123024 RepID=A0A511D3W0_9PSEU|nr:alpha/beta hydrolase [Pseudonocardia asaccharolytica]GEL18284.1 acetylhydrolase [Pseudonocardia asaccharolytica DSM 44247 = NBRC 16224]
MALDPQAKALIDALEAQGMKDFSEMTVEEARETGLAFIDLQGEPEEVGNVEERSIPGPEGEIPVRVYTPAGEGPHPVVVYFHGGGWVIGDLDVVDKPCRTLTNAANTAVVSVGYRKAPEHRYPAAVEDCYAATKWVAENGAELGLDISRIAVAGDSAGGNLAAIIAQLAKQRGGPSLVYQLLIYPAVDAAGDYPSYVENGEGYLLTKSAMDWFYRHYFGGDHSVAEEPTASPIRSDLSRLPPATVITAGYDPLRDEGDAYARKLAEAGVKTEHVTNPTMIHGFFWMLGAIDHTRGAFDQVGRQLKAAFGT